MLEAGEGSRWLPQLFEPWPSVVVVEARLGAEPVEMAPEEAAQVAGAVRRRRVEFAAGRWCARRALARFHIERFALRNGPDRAPRWPAGVVGSITHTGDAPGGFCGVVVGRAKEFRAVGLDAESSEILNDSVRAYVLTPREERQLAAHAPARRAALAKLIFSAKECFYKAQYPLSGRFLRFEDVEIELDVVRSTFEARLTSAAPPDLPLPACLGRFVTAEEIVLTGVAIPIGATEVVGTGVRFPAD